MEETSQNDKITQDLASGISSLGLDVPNEQQHQLIQYLKLLHKWNSSYNLSGIRDIEEMLRLHILDSLSVLPYIRGGLVADIGTGAGLPGIPLAICLPETRFILLDSNGKKTRFMFQAIMALGLDNVEVVNSRVEDYSSEQAVDIIVSRAFSSLKHFVLWTGHLLGDKGKLLAMKGGLPSNEIEELPAPYRLSQIIELSVPGENARRHLLEIQADS